MVVTSDTTREELTEALGHLSHRAARVICTSPEHGSIHAEINELLTAAGW